MVVESICFTHKSSWPSLSSITPSVIKDEQERVARVGFQPEPGREQLNRIERIKIEMREEPFSPPDRDTMLERLPWPEEELQEFLAYLEAKKEIYRVNPQIYFAKEAVEEAALRLQNYFQEQDSLDLALFRDMLDTSRKYALPLLEFFDSLGITVRKGDLRYQGKKSNLP
ncbi:MAG: SelB C-terminal domain-containing protein [Halanaerobium sp.]|nr:SelB C-terminal domain-containing protein [Halanaerobium sp.]